jgi:hypothetical protein
MVCTLTQGADLFLYRYFASVRSQHGELLVDDVPLGHQKTDGLLA